MDRKMNGRLQKWLVDIVVCLLFVLGTEALYVDITYVRSAVAKGAVCLDGSPPAYHIHRGFGAGVNNWLVHLEGGAWCENVKTCLARKNTQLGSSKKMAKRIAFTGILSNEPLLNPYFHNWNRVRVRYCDGSSFTGDIEAVNPATKLHYRGARVFVAVMEELFAEGMKNAENAVLSGCSAGGLASMLHCNKFKALFQNSTRVKCFADAGFFINVKDVSGAPYIENFYEGVARTHGSAKNLHTSCTSKMKPGLCFFPQNMAQGIQTPLFIVNAAYDSWQIRHILVPNGSDPKGIWRNCRDDLNKCTSSQLKILQGFRLDFLKALIGLGPSTSRGYFINSCYAHCQTEYQDTWLWSNPPVLDGKSIAEAVGDWYYDRSPFQKIDCPYPCDKTCHTRVVDPHGHALQ